MKILASDLDGTLYFHELEGYLKKQDVLAIHQFQNHGNLFGLSSGRTLAGVDHALNGLDVHLNFYILVSGASLLDENRHYIYRHLLPKSLIADICESMISGSALFCHDEDYYRFRPWDEENRATVVTAIAEAPFEYYDSLHLAYKNMKDLLEDKKILEARFHDVCEIHHNVLNLDVTPKNTSKGNALAALAELYQCQEIAVIGDSYNDISMMDAAKYAFTFHTSDAAVQKHADYLVDDIAGAISILEGMP